MHRTFTGNDDSEKLAKQNFSAGANKTINSVSRFPNEIYFGSNNGSQLIALRTFELLCFGSLRVGCYCTVESWSKGAWLKLTKKTRLDGGTSEMRVMESLRRND
jgi:hypothetical protein